MNLKVYGITIISVIILYLLLPFPKGFLFDVNSFSQWTASIKEFGVPMSYQNRVDYPPTMVYLLYLIGKFYNNTTAIFEDYKSLKVITFAFSALNGYLIYVIAKTIVADKVKLLYLKYIAFIYVFNPAIIFNVLIWGQVEEIAVFFLLIAILLMIKKRYSLMVVSLLFMLNLKLITIVFIPFFIVFVLFELRELNNNQKLFLVFFTLVSIPLFYSPFIINHQFYKLRNTLATVDTIPVLSANAYNFWYLFFKNPYISDKFLFLKIISLKQIGQLLFLTIGGFICIRDVIVRFVIKKNSALGSWFLLMAITLLLFFYFHTQMHERYGHMSIALLAIALVINNTKELLFLYLTISLGYCLNLVDVFFKYNSEFYSNLNMNPRYISIIFFVGIIMGIIFYFKIIKAEKTIEY